MCNALHLVFIFGWARRNMQCMHREWTLKFKGATNDIVVTQRIKQEDSKEKLVGRKVNGNKGKVKSVQKVTIYLGTIGFECDTEYNSCFW